MTQELVVFPRRERICLAAVVSESRTPDGKGTLTLVAEDGARFTFPSAQALARVVGVAPKAPAETVPQWLSRVRHEHTRPLDWDALHSRAAEGSLATLDDLVRLEGLEGDAGRVKVALASGAAEPWFRRDGGHWRVVPRADAEARLARSLATHRVESEDAALRAWWPRRASPPQESPQEANAALDALAAFALRGPAPESERGRVLAARIDLPEPDALLEELVRLGVLRADVNPAPQRSGLASAFSRGATEQALRIAAVPVESDAREDLTDLWAVAVDDAETTEVDDAISLREVAGGIEVLVHISDVASAIAVASPLDRAAAERASSLYLPESSVSMLPADVVTRLSLAAGVVREAVTGIFPVDGEGRVTAPRFVRSLVRVSRRLSYEETAGPEALGATPAQGRLVLETAEALRRARVAAGALVVNVDSLKVTVRDGEAHLVVRRQTTPGDVAVAESMVLFNREAAGLLAAHDAPAFYRVQGAPRDPEPKADDPLFALRVRRRFAPSSVSVEGGRHHGVGADAYLQATSPLRRFADLVNQRQLVATSAGEKTPYRHADLERLVAHVIERERTVRLAADDRVDYWVARTFEPRVGTTIEGVLARPPRRGFGAVWVPSLCRELPLVSPKDWTPPPEGTAATWRVVRAAPWRGRIELAPV